MHRRVEAKFREVAPDYQRPRAHSFKSLVLMLECLGLVERTGFNETSTEVIGLDKETGELRDVPRAGELRVDPDNGIQLPTYFRLTAGAVDRVEWADPVGRIATIYLGIQERRSSLPTLVPAGVAEPGEMPATPELAPGPTARPREAYTSRQAAPEVECLDHQRQLLPDGQ